MQSSALDGWSLVNFDDEADRKHLELPADTGRNAQIISWSVDWRSAVKVLVKMQIPIEIFHQLNVEG